MKVITKVLVGAVIVGLIVFAGGLWWYFDTAERRAASNEARARLAAGQQQSTPSPAASDSNADESVADPPAAESPMSEPQAAPQVPEPVAEPVAPEPESEPVDEPAPAEAVEAEVVEVEPAPEMTEAPATEVAETAAPQEEVPNDRESHEIFTQEWVEAWGAELNASEAYRNAGTGWEWPVALIAEADPEIGLEDKLVFLDLNNGHCREARMGTGDDLEKCGFILSATPQTWKQVIEGQRNITAALLGGDVQLLEGKLPVLMQYMRSANLMVDLAGELNTTYPEGL